MPKFCQEKTFLGKSCYIINWFRDYESAGNKLLQVTVMNKE